MRANGCGGGTIPTINYGPSSFVKPGHPSSRLVSCFSFVIFSLCLRQVFSFNLVHGISTYDHLFELGSKACPRFFTKKEKRGGPPRCEAEWVLVRSLNSGTASQCETEANSIRVFLFIFHNSVDNSTTFTPINQSTSLYEV